MQKNVLKQQFENFFVSDTEGLDKAYDRFQKLISQLEVHGAAVSNEDANQKFLRALPSSWNNIALIMRNKEGIDELDIDDLYNNLKVFEADIKAGHSSQGQASSSSYIDDLMLNALTVIEGAILPRNVEHQEIKDNALIMQDGLGYDWSYIAQDEPTEFALMAYTSNSSGSDTEFEVKEKGNAITRLTNQLDQTLKEKEDLKAKLEQFETSSKNLNKLINGYHAVPPPLTRNYMPPLADLSFARLDDSVYRPAANKTSASISNDEASVTQTSNINVEVPKDNSVRTNEVLIE
ncbi:hypothetical protein Tco_1189600, partial [Tanacetum coccineum]